MTPDFNCGSECETGAPGSTPIPNRRHWSGVAGPVTSQTAIALNGGRAYRFQPAGTGNCYLQRIPGNWNVRTWRGKLRFGTLPNANCSLIRAVVAAGSVPALRYRSATQDIIAQVGATTTGAVAVPVVTGVWYRICLRIDVSTGNRTVSLTVDGVDKGTALLAEAATTADEWRIGATAAGDVITADIVWDDIVTGTVGADYPMPDGQIIGLQLVADGAHNFSAAGDFKYGNGANVLAGAANTWSFISHRLGALGTFLQATNPAAGEYLEWLLGGMPAADAIHCLELVSAYHSAATAPHKQTLRIVDGGTVADVFTDADFSQIALTYDSKHYATAPSGGAWTRAKINALKFRWGSSWTAPDVVDTPYIDGLMAEVDCVLSAVGPGSPPPSPNPERWRHSPRIAPVRASRW